MDIRRIGINSATLPGTLQDKIDAARATGFTTVELNAKDLLAHPEGAAVAARKVRESGLKVSAFQVLREIGGNTEREFEYRIEAAKSILELAASVGCRLLIVSSATAPTAIADPEVLAHNLSVLGTLATPMGIRIGYEALPWGRWVSEYTDAWRVVELANRKNVGLVVDSFQILMRQTAIEPLQAIPADRIFLVQISDYKFDFISEIEDFVEVSRHERVFPGEGAHGQMISELVTGLERNGYRGDYTLDVFSDDNQHSELPRVMTRAQAAVQWLTDKATRV
ncbi:sugar phosphate isomerase/epimerase [Azoarcus sp. KH32C]|uniref:sugar phosphate isomerase/epimerase family protein n=1 Tax=Azoarcus sp. KH32C TaxID=748247 RepID=UPI0002385C77|nr:sugar phosphate isomerase/epimerase family protein [Azoarcus sp. KH32C]BAL27430.1 putative 4-hydroxyphenylpyruvate dioxygenase [Azoarcus sp. KH32C]